MVTKAILVSLAFSDLRAEAIAEQTTADAMTETIAGELMQKRFTGAHDGGRSDNLNRLVGTGPYAEDGAENEDAGDDADPAAMAGTEATHWYPPPIWVEASASYQAMDPQQRARRIERITQEVDRNMGEMESSVGGMWTFLRSIWGIGWTITAVGGAFSLGCGRKPR